MSSFDKIIDLSKKIAKTFIKGKHTVDLDSSDEILDKDGNVEIFKKLNQESYWNERKKFLSQINTNKEWKVFQGKISPSKKPVPYFKYAAVIAVMIGLTSFFLFRNYSETPSYDTIVGGSEKAILTLESGEEVTLSNTTNYNNKNAHVQNSQLVYSASQSSKSRIYNFLTIPRGGTFFIELSDHTKIWLNSESKLKYPRQFVSGEIREVELVYGEAYFEVSHSTENGGDSFKVITNGQEVDVLGTEFNIEAYRNEEYIYTTLNKGSIQVNNGAATKIIVPGEQSVTNSENTLIEVNKVKVENAIAWKNGLFLFDKKPLSEMMEELSRWYDVDIVFKNDKKRDYYFSGELNREDNIQKLLNSIEKTGEVKFTLMNKVILIE